MPDDVVLSLLGKNKVSASGASQPQRSGADLEFQQRTGVDFNKVSADEIVSAQEKAKARGVKRPTLEDIAPILQKGQLGKSPSVEQAVKGEEQKQGLEQQFQEAGVFKDVNQQPIISPEQENLGVIKDIFLSLIPENTRKTLRGIDTFGGALDFSKPPKNQAEAEIQTKALTSEFQSQVGKEIDGRIEDTEKVLINNGIPLGGVGGVVGGAIIGGAVGGPFSQFVGSDRTISNLELALSQYNEMITLPAQAVSSSGMSSTEAFDKLNRMEDGIDALEYELKKAAITSPNVRISLRGRGVDARLLKLKEKIQVERQQVAFTTTQQAFGEVPLSDAALFLQELKSKNKNEKE